MILNNHNAFNVYNRYYFYLDNQTVDYAKIHQLTPSLSIKPTIHELKNQTTYIIGILFSFFES